MRIYRNKSKNEKNLTVNFVRMRTFASVIIVVILFVIIVCHSDDEEDNENNLVFMADDKDLETLVVNQEIIQTLDKGNPQWYVKVVQEIGFYLRSYKFSEWDRRNFTENPNQVKNVTNFSHFPNPPLKKMHPLVQQNCEPGFYHCIEFLHRVIALAPFQIKDDTNFLINDMENDNYTDDVIDRLDKDCLYQVNAEMVNGLPFTSLLARFIWKTSASYYMCYYTLLEQKELKHFGIPCDNFAMCLDKTFGPYNGDPRANDSNPFFCAMYSFCPDMVCPVKHIKVVKDCKHNHHSEFNCAPKTKAGVEQDVFDRTKNRDLYGIMHNFWNLSCACKTKGFIWSSIDGMCVDVDECADGSHTCNLDTQNCLNLPGSFHCICNWGFDWDEKTKSCYQSYLNIGPKPLEKGEL